MGDRTLTVHTPAGRLAARAVGAGVPVLLVHGIPGSAAVWEEVTGGLVATGFRVVVPDLLGFGASDRPADVERLWLDAQVAALAALLDAADTGPVIAVGHDYGAPISVLLAHRHAARVSGLVLAAGNLFTDTPIPPPLSATTAPLVGGLAARLLLSGPLLRAVLWLGVGRPRVRLDPAVYLGDGAQRRAIATIFATALRELPSRYRAVEAALGELRQPTAVLWGGRDPFFGLEQARRARAAIPAATLRVDPQAGHFLPAERPAALIDTVARLRGPAEEPSS